MGRSDKNAERRWQRCWQGRGARAKAGWADGRWISAKGFYAKGVICNCFATHLGRNLPMEDETRKITEKSASGGLVEKAIRIAVEAHAGQKDKSGQPYILHPLRLMLHGLTDDERITDALHDVVQATPWTLVALMEEGISRRVLYALD